MSGKKNKNTRKQMTAAMTQMMDLPVDQLRAIIARTQSGPLSTDEHETLKAAMDTLVATQQLVTFLREELQGKHTSIERMRRLVFGVTSEKTAKVLGRSQEGEPPPTEAASVEGSPGETAKPKRKGHGRNGVAALTGADREPVPHPFLARGEGCSNDGCTGKVYPLKEPRKLVRITGVAPLSATIYECERVRCNLCQDVFTAPAPAGIGDEKYDESATAMVGMIKYGAGLPFNRNEKLQAGMGIPLPASTQWDLVKSGSSDLEPVHEALIDTAADGKVLHNDDTTMKVLKLSRAERAAALSDDEESARTGVFTSGIVSTSESKQIALFFTGPRHAGENLAEVLKRRSALLPTPIQMCDALSRNVPEAIETILAKCLTHSRRKYVEVMAGFPDEVVYVLTVLSEVYRTDAQAKTDKCSPEGRLARHQRESGPRMDDLARWMERQLETGKIERNSTLGEAIEYMQDHWIGLTQFLRVAGAPLDNNLCERVLKKAILHRKNSLFYRTLKGAAVGDRWMSLIHTAELNGVAPFEYLVAVLRNADAAALDPRAWMPWNYRDTLAKRSPQCAVVEEPKPAMPVRSSSSSAAVAFESNSTLCHRSGARA